MPRPSIINACTVPTRVACRIDDIVILRKQMDVMTALIHEDAALRAIEEAIFKLDEAEKHAREALGILQHLGSLAFVGSSSLAQATDDELRAEAVRRAVATVEF